VQTQSSAPACDRCGATGRAATSTTFVIVQRQSVTAKGFTGTVTRTTRQRIGTVDFTLCDECVASRSARLTVGAALSVIVCAAILVLAPGKFKLTAMTPAAAAYLMYGLRDKPNALLSAATRKHVGAANGFPDRELWTVDAWQRAMD
jgi:hypothetical protein